MAVTANISKSIYCFGVQCPKIVWLKKHKPEEYDKSVMNQSILDAGTEVGKIARGIFGPYTLVEKNDDLGLMVEETKRLFSAGEKVIAEASFSYDGLFCSVDILKNLGNGIVEIYEVKSSSHSKDIYLHDVSFQVYVLEKCGYKVNRACLLYINNKYVRGKELEIEKLFAVEDLTDVARQMQPEVSERTNLLKEYAVKTEEPNKDLGLHCFSPYDCGFWRHCSDHLPSPNVFDIANMADKKKVEYYKQGIISFEDVYKNVNLRKEHKLQVRYELENPSSDYIEKDKIKAFLETLTYPLYFLDFESFLVTIPPYENTKPGIQIPFQYSLHYIEEKGGPIKHEKFLGNPGEDPRRAIAEKLCRDIPLNVCTLAYYMSFEKGRIKELAKLFPDLADHLMNIHDNIHDLIDPFKQKLYYSKEMKGSASIKKVLPALFPGDPELDYHNLEGVHNGSEALGTFIAMEKMSPEEQEVKRQNLLDYCYLDTWAMVRIFQKLQECVN